MSLPIGLEVGLTYELVGPDGTRAVINDSTDPDWVGFLNGEDGVTGLDGANVRENADTLAGASGRSHGTFLTDGLAFTLKGIIPPDGPGGAASWVTRQDKIKRATKALGADGSLFWTPSEAVPVFINFRAQQRTRLAGRRPKTFLVAGVSEDPGIFSQALHTTIIDAAAAVAGGFSSLLASPLASAAAIGGQAFVTNLGDGDAWPVLRIYGPCVNPAVINATEGRGLYFIYSLAAGEFLEVDTNPRRRRILINGQTNRYNALDSSRSAWWSLGPDANDIRLAFASYSAGAKVELDHRDTWD